MFLTNQSTAFFRINDVLEQHFKHNKDKKGKNLPETASSKGDGITSSLNERKNENEIPLLLHSIVWELDSPDFNTTRVIGRIPTWE